MKLARVLQEILSSPSFKERPPVVLDIGGSGGIPSYLRPIARVSRCLSFDPDPRDVGAIRQSDREWKELHFVPAVASDTQRETVPFFLTASPHCSSSLRPDAVALANWDYAELFDVKEEVCVSATSLNDALETAGITYVDWFKTDSQGTDLRLWQSLSTQIKSSVSVASFEPGIISTYVGEDKLHSIMAEMDREPWFLARMDVRGARRVPRDFLSDSRSFRRRIALAGLQRAPGWVEAWYVKDMSLVDEANERQMLMAWSAATMLGQHGFAYELARRWASGSPSPWLQECKRISQHLLSRPNLRTAASIWHALQARVAT